MRPTIRRWLLAGAFTIGGTLGALAVADSAHAADRHPTVAVEHTTPPATAGSDTIGQLLASLTAPATTEHAAHPTGCPDRVPDTLGCTPAAVVVGAAAAGALAPAILAATGVPAAPMLGRLTHARARSTIPASPAAHLDPRPA